MQTHATMELSSSTVRGEYLKTCCKPLLQPKWSNNKGAILILIWSFLGANVYNYFTISQERDPIKEKAKLHPEEIITIISIFLPVGGWLADAYFGRYKVILCGMWAMWLGAMLNGISLVIGMVVAPYREHGDPWVSIGFKAMMGAGFGVFQANIIQFGIDQLLEASSTEITSFITWYAVTLFASGTLMFFSAYCASDYAAVLVVAVCLSLALCSNFILNHWLVKEHIINNPLPQIRKVVLYTIRNRHHRQRLPTCEEGEDQGILSRLNIAKTLYAGPFTSEQVEDVKTFFRVIGIIATFMIACSGITVVYTAENKMEVHLHNWPKKLCYEQLSICFFPYTFVLAMVLVYKIIIHPLFHDYIPKVNVSITTKFIIAVFLLILTIITLLGIESASYYYQVKKNETVLKCLFADTDGRYTYDVDIKVYWIIIPAALNGLSIFMFILSGIEFICAQAPFNMKGIVFGMAYTLFGLGNLIQSVLSIPFLTRTQSAWEKAPLTCGIWYFIIQAVIEITSFIVVVIVIKRYKQRKRSNTTMKHWPQADTQIDTINW